MKIHGLLQKVWIVNKRERSRRTSSRICLLDLQFELVERMETIKAPLDHLDLIIDTPQQKVYPLGYHVSGYITAPLVSRFMGTSVSQRQHFQ